jgi:hybrid cluster-associated redox disulfide protein
MEGYVKGFVGASLVYFLAGAALGLYSAIGDAGASMIFAHVHLNLLGFMTMMIYGVGYFIIPRFNATTLRWPGILPYHFWIANAGLILMVATYSSFGSPGFTGWLFRIGAISQAVSVFFFCVHILVTMYSRATLEDETVEDHRDVPTEKEAPVPSPAPVQIDPDIRVGEILERWPDSITILIDGGLTPLSDPEHAEHVKQMPVTLRMACMRHQADLDWIVQRLTELTSKVPSRVTVGSGHGGEETALPDKSTVIKDVLKAHPETETVFRKHYGDGCFSCPGQSFESISQSALMHNVDPDKLLTEIHEVIKSGNSN